MIEHLHQQWITLTNRYTQQHELQEKLWQEIYRLYTQPHRHYHNCTHIAALLHLAANFREQLVEPDVVEFSIWYHDSIYNPLRKDNEQKSAELAELRLEELGLPAAFIQSCSRQILATQSHQAQEKEEDTNYLLDFDLSILAATWPDYKTYTQQIRKEYRMYPNFMYKKGRRKVLQHFLSMETIYKTHTFQAQYEAAARANIERELQELV